jgi:lipoyl-dependent peroxiredoxin
MPAKPLSRILYTAEAIIEGGRAGHGRTTDGRLDLQLSVPEDMGGQGGPGTNPEQLFAVGFGACFQSALLGVAQGRKLDASDTKITARVGIGPPGTAASACRWPWTCTPRTSHPPRSPS